MSANKYIIFDFDGTLVDSIELAINVYNRIAPKYKCKPIQDEARELLSSRNPQKYFKEYGVTPFKLLLLVYTVRRELGKHISDMNPVKGMDAALRDLRKAGYKLGVLTSNSRKNVSRFLENNKLADLFEFICSGRHLLGKDKVILDIIKKETIPADSVLYVGDETRDALAMKKAGIPIISVSWGLTKREKLETLHPTAIADSPAELLTLANGILNI